MQRIKDFFGEIDQKWSTASPEKVRLRIIGCGALMLQTNYERGTKDSDVFDTIDLAAETKEHLLRLAGPNTQLANRRLMYVDIVANGIPFLPHGALWHPIAEVNGVLQRFEVLALDVVDVVVTKLKPFRPNDKADIDAMIERDLVPHERLVDRFRSAADDWARGAYADKLYTYVKNLNEVERDMLGVDETEIELPIATARTSKRRIAREYHSRYGPTGPVVGSRLPSAFAAETRIAIGVTVTHVGHHWSGTSSRATPKRPRIAPNMMTPPVAPISTPA